MNPVATVKVAKVAIVTVVAVAVASSAPAKMVLLAEHQLTAAKAVGNSPGLLGAQEVRLAASGVAAEAPAADSAALAVAAAIPVVRVAPGAPVVPAAVAAAVCPTKARTRFYSPM